MNDISTNSIAKVLSGITESKIATDKPKTTNIIVLTEVASTTAILNLNKLSN